MKKQIEITNERFGAQRDLLLLDNNVLASKCYEEIIDEIKECGFAQGATYTAPNEYDITIRNLRESYNDRAYIRKAVKIYMDIIDRLKNEEEKTELYMKFEENHCLYHYTATKEHWMQRQGLGALLGPNYLRLTSVDIIFKYFDSR